MDSGGCRGAGHWRVILSNSRSTRATKDDSGLPSAQASNAAPVPKNPLRSSKSEDRNRTDHSASSGYVQYRITINA